MPDQTQDSPGFPLSTITHTISNVFSSIGTFVEQYFFGNAREYFLAPNTFKKKLFQKAHQSEEGMAVSSLGILGNVAVVTPLSQDSFAKVLDQLDMENTGRKAHTSFQFFSGSDSFILASTGHKALIHRKQLSGFLIAPNFIRPLITAVEKEFKEKNEIKLRQTVCHVVRTVMVNVILGVQTLPENTYEIMQNYRNDTKQWGAFALPGLFKYMPSLNKKRALYSRFAEDILAEQFSSVEEGLKHNTSEKKNLIRTMMVNLIKQDYSTLSEEEFSNVLENMSQITIKKYFEHDSIKSLPFLLKAADNLTDAITLCFNKLLLDPDAMEQLRHEIDIKNIFTDDGSIAQHKLIHDFPLLDAWYKECLRFDSPVVIPRYTQQGIKTDSITIPPKTTIMFDTAAINKSEKYWQQPNSFVPERFLPGATINASERDTAPDESSRTLNKFPFIPFSVGNRMCPAFKVTEYMFKTFIVCVLKDFNLRLISEGKEESLLGLERIDNSLVRHNL